MAPLMIMMFGKCELAFIFGWTCRICTYCVHRHLDALPGHLQCIVHKLSKITGFQFTVYCGGRNEDNVLTVYMWVLLIISLSLSNAYRLSVHGGKCAGTHPTTFGGFIGQKMNDQITQLYQVFILYPQCTSLHIGYLCCQFWLCT